MKRLTAALAASFALLLLATAPAFADFGLSNFDVTFTNQDGTMATQAGSHPYEMTSSFDVNASEGPLGEPILDEAARVLEFDQVTGFAGNPTAVPACPTVGFLSLSPIAQSSSVPDCPDSSAIGIVTVALASKGGVGTITAPVYNLESPPGAAARVGFVTANVRTAIDLNVSEAASHDVHATVSNISQVLEVVSSKFVLWGVPAAPDHDPLRGKCVVISGASAGNCPAGIAEKPFLTLPRACEGPLATSFQANSWLNPNVWVKGSTLTHDASGNPRGMSGCGKLAFGPQISTQPTNSSAESPTGLDVDLDVHDDGLTNPKGIAASDLKKAVVTLPKGVTVNPSQAEGLGVCSEEGFAREKAASEPGAGCPQSSKIGTVEVESPLLEEKVLKGSLYVAAPYTNRFGTLIALYLTIKSSELGINIDLAGRVEPDPKTGQLITTFEGLPQLPFSHFHLHFREGGRSPLVTPPRCGTFATQAVLTPWANPSQPLTTTTSFEITSGVGGGSCPPGGVPPFHPGFEAGSQNNNAKSYSPFYMRLLRADGEQDMTKFSSILPPGVLGKLAGVSKCPDANIATAASKSGLQELAIPSCPINSQIGHILAGAGVGGELTYVSGKAYLGGPYKGDPLSVIVITPAVAGPFDAGDIVTRVALTLNPETAEVEADGAHSDPIPHILKGIPLKVRDIRVYIDRPDFILNPTSCDPSSAKATLFGSFLNVFDSADDVPVGLSTRYQAANCLNLGFKPKLSLKLNGGTKRGDHPALKAVLRAREGDANIGSAVVTLPRSAFLDQAHIRTICTRVQFAAKQCPKGAQYGYAKAWTPLLEETIQGPVYLRSSTHNLPDLVAALHGLVDVDVVGRIDSFKGGIRSSFETVPDAPVSKFILTMQGGKKGLIVNSRSLCARKARVDARFSGQNGVPYHFHPVLGASCGQKRGKK